METVVASHSLMMALPRISFPLRHTLDLDAVSSIHIYNIKPSTIHNYNNNKIKLKTTNHHTTHAILFFSLVISSHPSTHTLDRLKASHLSFILSLSLSLFLEVIFTIFLQQLPAPFHVQEQKSERSSACLVS